MLDQTRPSWYNGSSPLLDSDSRTIRHQSVLQEDGTYLTTSYVKLRLSRHHHLNTIRCQATNEVMESTGSPPQEDQYTLSVKFAPVLSPVSASQTVNISSQVRPPPVMKKLRQNSY